MRYRCRLIVEATIPMDCLSRSTSAFVWAHWRLSSPRQYFPSFCSMHGLFLTSMGCKVSSRRRYHSSCITYHGRAKWVSAHSIVEATISAPSFLHCTSHRQSRGIIASTIPGCRTHIGQTVHFSNDTATCTISLLLRQWHEI